MKRVVAVLYLLVLTQFVIAQTEPVELNAVVVESTVSNSTEGTTGRNIQIVTAKDISLLPINSVDELFRYLPGIEIQSRGGFGVQSDFTLRGSTYNQVLILINGVRINDPLTGHFNGYIPVPLSEIERVEVVKGPVSSLYGADAVGGLVNIITRKPSYEEELHVNATLKAGSHGLLGTDVSMYQTRKKWNFSLGVQSNSSDGEQLLNPNYGIVDSAPPQYNTWFKTNTVSGGIGRKLSENWDMTLRGSYDERDFGAKYFYTVSPYDESVEKTKIWFSNLHISGTTERFQTTIDGLFRQSSDYFAFNPLFDPNEHTTNFGLFQFNQIFDWTKKSTLTYGTQIDFRDITSNDRGNHSNFHMGVFGQLNTKLTSQLVANVSLRADYDNNYKFEFCPQVNVAYNYKKWIFRGGVGRGIRAGDYTERFVSTNLSALSPGRNLGNPDLIAESSWNYELGANYSAIPGLRIVATGFIRISDNLIDYIPTLGKEITNVDVLLVPNETYLYADNLTLNNTAGVEGELWYTKSTKGNNQILAKLGYTGLATVNPDGVVSKYVSSHAKHLINGSASYSWSNLDVSISGLYKMRDTAYSSELNVVLEPTYVVINSEIGYRFLDKKMKVQGQVLNIFDVQYSDILGAKMPGRWVVLSLNFTI